MKVHYDIIFCLLTVFKFHTLYVIDSYVTLTYLSQVYHILLAVWPFIPFELFLLPFGVVVVVGVVVGVVAPAVVTAFVEFVANFGVTGASACCPLLPVVKMDDSLQVELESLVLLVISLS